MSFRSAFKEEIQKEAFWKELLGIVKKNKGTKDVRQGMENVSKAIKADVPLQISNPANMGLGLTTISPDVNYFTSPAGYLPFGKKMDKSILFIKKPQNIKERMHPFHKILETNEETNLRYQMAKMHEMFEAISMDPRYKMPNYLVAKGMSFPGLKTITDKIPESISNKISDASWFLFPKLPSGQRQITGTPFVIDPNTWFFGKTQSMHAGPAPLLSEKFVYDSLSKNTIENDALGFFSKIRDKTGEAKLVQSWLDDLKTKGITPEKVFGTTDYISLMKNNPTKYRDGIMEMAEAINPRKSTGLMDNIVIPVPS